MAKRPLKRPSCTDVTQRALDLDPRSERRVSVEEQSLKSRQLANKQQKKAYTKWISTVHHFHIEDLYTDLRDGKVLIKLLEVVSGETIPVPTRKGMAEAEVFLGIERIQTAFQFLQEHNVRLENIRPKDIQEGKEKETLALIWAIILYHIVVMCEPVPDHEQPLDSINQAPVTVPQEQTAMKTLLQWCQKTTQGYPGVHVTDFVHSWKDGLAFNAIIHKHRSDLIVFESLQAENIIDNLNNAFDVAEKQLGIPKLLDVEDMIFPDQRSVVVYISLYYSFFRLKYPKLSPSPAVTVPISAPTPNLPIEEVQEPANEVIDTAGTQTMPPSTQSGASLPPYPPPKYTPRPAGYPSYQQPYYQQPYKQPYRPVYHQQPYRPAYYQQPYYRPPMPMQQQMIQVQTGMGMLTVGAQQGAGAMQSSFVQLGSTKVGAVPQPAKAPAKTKGKKSKK